MTSCSGIHNISDSDTISGPTANNILAPSANLGTYIFSRTGIYHLPHSHDVRSSCIFISCGYLRGYHSILQSFQVPPVPPSTYLAQIEPHRDRFTVACCWKQMVLCRFRLAVKTPEALQNDVRSRFRADSCFCAAQKIFMDCPIPTALQVRRC